MDSALLQHGLAFECPPLKKQQKPLVVPDAGSLVDVFQIDDLLDFSNEDIAGPIGEADFGNSSLPATVPTVVSKAETFGCLQTPSSCVEKGTEYHHTAKAQQQQLEETEIEADLCAPYDDLEELEWESRFLDDSFPVAGDSSKGTWSMSDGSVISIEEKDMEISALFSKQQRYEKATSPVSVLEQQTSATSSELTLGSEHSLDFCVVRGRARSKRSRSSGGKKWTSSGLILSSSTTTSCGTNEMSIAPSLWSAGEEDEEEEEDTVEEGEEWQSGNFHKPPKQNRKLACHHHQQQEGGGGHSVLRCRHCQTQRTPQWRTGPMGPKTLCNACGVRYKSGRLLPEYRPASSPAYIPHKHSNSHKKVLEMRRQREMMEA